MNFTSDNVSGMAPEILQALIAANDGAVPAFGDDACTRRALARIADVFETPTESFFVTSGTAANALALSVLVPPVGTVYCHEQAHIETMECGAPGFYSGGAALHPLPGANGKLDGATLREVLRRRTDLVGQAPPSALSLTQGTEAGTLYTPDELRELCALAHAHGLRVHMDGARFANAVASLGCRPADASWRAGVDVLSFGATKNGALAVDAVVMFDRSLAATFEYHRQRGGHRIAKTRFLSAQFDAYLRDEVWLRNAARANAMAERLAAGVRTVPGAVIHFPTEINMVWVTLPEEVIEGLLADGFRFSRRGGDQKTRVRLVTAFNTAVEAVDAFVAAAHRHARGDGVPVAATASR
jgi:threonine aldolase